MSTGGRRTTSGTDGGTRRDSASFSIGDPASCAGLRHRIGVLLETWRVAEAADRTTAVVSRLAHALGPAPDRRVDVRIHVRAGVLRAEVSAAGATAPRAAGTPVPGEPGVRFGSRHLAGTTTLWAEFPVPGRGPHPAPAAPRGRRCTVVRVPRPRPAH